ncbi:MAG: DUF1508 domain-containing protein, partial [Pseudomonas sp.]
INDPGRLEAVLLAGAEKARAVAKPFMAELRQAVGLRSLGSGAVAAPKHKAARTAAPAFKQYREKDSRFYFKLLDADARLLLQSQGFDSPRDAAQAISALQKEGPTALAALQDKVAAAPGISASEVAAALHFFADNAH